jgi:hypothetical protein
MKSRVSGRYWSKGQFRNRGINVLSSFPSSPVVKQSQSSRVEGAGICYAILLVLVRHFTG